MTRPLTVVSAGMFLNRRLRRILRGAGYEMTLHPPPPDGLVAVWGQGRWAS